MMNSKKIASQFACFFVSSVAWSAVDKLTNSLLDVFFLLANHAKPDYIGLIATMIVYQMAEKAYKTGKTATDAIAMIKTIA
ncbi:MAG: hypothetical protein WBB28_01795 [Crinalium sp.]